jgi:hypothetical protein
MEEDRNLWWVLGSSELPSDFSVFRLVPAWIYENNLILY